MKHEVDDQVDGLYYIRCWCKVGHKQSRGLMMQNYYLDLFST